MKMRLIVCVATFVMFPFVVMGQDTGPTSKSKRAYTMVDYLCHRQPYLSICGERKLRSTAYSSPKDPNRIKAYDSKGNKDADPMPTPGPLPIEGENPHHAYDVARRREQQEPETRVDNREKILVQQQKVETSSSRQDDRDLLVDGDTDQVQIHSTETTSPSTTDGWRRWGGESQSTSTEQSHGGTEISTQSSINPRLRYELYQKALNEYYKLYYPQHQQQEQQQTHSRYSSYDHDQNQQQFYPQNDYYYYSNQQQQQPYSYPSYYSQQRGGGGVGGQSTYPGYYYQPAQPQQTYYPQQQQQSYQQHSNGFNFGLGSQLQIPFAGPLGISSGFGFGGK